MTAKTPFSSTTHLNLSHWIPTTQAEGPGRRFALWVQGCDLRCPGCCNPEMFAFAPRHLLTVSEVLAMILEAKERHQIEGISCLGGEPFSQAHLLAQLAKETRTHGLSVMVFSGFTLAEIQASPDPAAASLLAELDILVDGRFQQENYTEERRWIGSTNQKVHFFTSRYQPEDPCWKEKNTVEVYFDGKDIKVTGFPKPAWREEILRWRRQIEEARKLD